MKRIVPFSHCKRYFNYKTIAFISALVIGSMITGSRVFAQAKTEAKSGTSANDIIIHQEADFKVSPGVVYQTLLSSAKFSACTKKSFPVFTDKSAVIDSIAGGSFSVFDGHIIGRILELVPGQRIVQAWRVVDWPAGVYSIAKFELKPQGSGTHLVFDHVGFPEGLKEHLSTGWQQHYWDALNSYFQ
jgi:activator of HSP90 ATPase